MTALVQMYLAEGLKPMKKPFKRLSRATNLPWDTLKKAEGA